MGTPVVRLEPSCVAVFKDELGKLLPHDEDGKRLACRTQIEHGAGRKPLHLAQVLALVCTGEVPSPAGRPDSSAHSEDSNDVDGDRRQRGAGPQSGS